MAFTEYLHKQMEQLASLKEEFSRLEAMEKVLRRQAGLPEQGGEPLDMGRLSAAERTYVEEAMAEARRAGEARAAQTRLSPTISGGGQPGARRRGVVRL